MTSKRKRSTRPLVTPFEEDADPVTPPRGGRANRAGGAGVRGKADRRQDGIAFPDWSRHCGWRSPHAIL
jgi:hypothetical protein